LLQVCGAINVFAEHPDPYPSITLDEVAAGAPDVVLAPSEPYPWAERHRPLLSAIAPMVLVDGQDLFWWGVRTPGAIARIAGQLASLVGVGGS
jgi:ABC-type Fe2+-enterobactin transport system substrate-binding protein